MRLRSAVRYPGLRDEGESSLVTEVEALLAHAQDPGHPLGLPRKITLVVASCVRQARLELVERSSNRGSRDSIRPVEMPALLTGAEFGTRRPRDSQNISPSEALPSLLKALPSLLNRESAKYSNY